MAQEENAGLGDRVSIMATTHFTLATRRSSTIAESTGRATLFLTSVSMSLVALGFLAEALGQGPAFTLFVYIILLALLAVGAVTFDRVLQTSVEDG